MPELGGYAATIAAVREVLADKSRSRWLFLTDVPEAARAMAALGMTAMLKGAASKDVDYAEFGFKNTSTGYQGKLFLLILPKRYLQPKEIQVTFELLVGAHVDCTDDPERDCVIVSNHQEVPAFLQNCKDGAVYPFGDPASN